MKRPAGVILASIVLGCFAALELLAAALYVFLAATFRHGVPVQAPQPGMTAGTYLTAIMAFMSVLFAALAAWAIFTLIGLLRLRNWARYSVLVIGGCLAALGTLSVAGSIFASAFLPANPNLPPHTMQSVFLFMGLIYALVAAVGIWWLVYFNLRSTKAFFLPHYLPHPVSQLGAQQPAVNFSQRLDSEAWDGAPPPPIPTPTPGRFARVPTSIIVLACLFLLGALCCIPCAFLPFPAFLFGFLLYRPASVLLYVAFAIAAALVGLGLLRLSNRARLGVYALSSVGIVNFLILLTPWGQSRYTAYQQSLYATMQFPGVPPPQPLNPHALTLFIAIFCLLFYGVQIWLIERHRQAFR